MQEKRTNCGRSAGLDRKFSLSQRSIRILVQLVWKGWIIFRVLNLFWIFGSSETRLLCIVGELAGGGTVAVAVGISGR